MERPYVSRRTLAICGALAILLGRLAVVQYRWATTVAAADAQREKEHLNSAATLFANEFNSAGTQAAAFLQNEAWSALQSGRKLPALPKLISEVYYLDLSDPGGPKGRRLTAEGLFAPATLPEWAALTNCDSLALQEPPAMVAPVFITSPMKSDGPAGAPMKTSWEPAYRCFVGRIDQTYLRNLLFPQLIGQSFGAASASEYHFAVVWRNRPGDFLYGGTLTPDLRKPFFSIRPNAFSKEYFMAGDAMEQPAVVEMQQTMSMGHTKGAVPLAGPGVWILEVAHKGMPLAAVFEMARRRNLGMGLGMLVLLFTAITFLVVATERTQRLASRKMQFVAGVSHELRTPVSAISLLSRNQADGLVVGPERVRQYGELIHQQSRRLNEMVEQTLQYAGIHSELRGPSTNLIDPGHIIREVVDARREDLARGGFELEIDVSPDLPAVRGDAALLRTAVDNLLNNAQKHAGGGRWIRVSAGYFPARREVRISVEDRGAGIDPEDQAGIFEPFYRGQAALDAQIPGSGLGLSLVRSAAEAHRGSVTLVSSPGQGSTFTLHLPA